MTAYLDCQQLQAAVSQPGGQAEAERLVERLVKSRCRVRIYVDPEVRGPSGGGGPLPDDSLLVSVTFQTRSNRLSVPMQLVLPRGACVADLKSAALMAFDLPPDVQRCIVAGRVPCEGETMGELAGDNGALLQVRTYLLTDQKSWPPDPQLLQRLKDSVLQERQRRLTVGTGGEGDVEAAVEVAAPVEEENEEPGWSCPQCTYRNPPGRPGCVLCSHDRPEDYEVPAEFQALEELRQEQLQADFLRQAAQNRELNARTMMTLAQASLIPVANQQAFECPVCMADIGGDGDGDGAVGGAGARGIRLRECGHEVCSDCLRGHAQNADTLPVLCPCAPCQQVITDAELAQLLTPVDMARLQRLGLRQAEAVIANAFHCVTPNCEAFVELADDVNDFNCQVCGEHNCVTCKASHKDLTCRQFQDELRLRAQNDDDARLGLAKLEEMLQSGEAMKCPKCKVFLQKREGCDFLKCSVCQTEICWATKGPRWGPAGQGDTSGGCRCRVDGKRCHPQCQNCH